MTAECFVNEYCAVMKQAEAWVRAQERTFGVVATGFRAFERAVCRLQSEPGRRAIWAWMRDAEMRKTPNFALDDLTALVAEMQRTKAGTNKSLPDSQGSAASGGEAGSAASADASPSAGAPPSLEEDEEAMCMMTEAAEEQQQLVDPVVHKAETLAETELAAVSIHSELRAWAMEVAASVFDACKCIVYIECPTSRLQVFHEFLKMQGDFPKTYDVFVPVGPRLDVLGSLSQALAARWPRRPVYSVLLSTGKQNARIRPSYALYMPAELGEAVPTSISVSGCRAACVEGVRMRCTASSCPLRPMPAGADEGADENAEIPPDDREAGEYEGCFEAGEDELDPDAAAVMAASSGEGSGRAMTNLFPYAAPVAVHARVFSEVLRSHEKSHLLLLTRTGHPGLIVAAREASLKVIALQSGVSPHSAAHGLQLLKQIFTTRKMGIARKLVQPLPVAGQKRPLDDMQYISAQAPQEQAIKKKKKNTSNKNSRTKKNRSKPSTSAILSRIRSRLGAGA